MMHRQADDLIGNLSGNRQILWCCTGQTTIGAEGADERIKIPAAKNTICLHLEIEFIACAAVLLRIDEDGEIAIVVAYTWCIIKETDAGNIS